MAGGCDRGREDVNDKFTLSGNVLYVSGDDDASDTDAANFDSIDVDAQVGVIFFKDTILADCDRTISDAPYIMDKGLSTTPSRASIRSTKKTISAWRSGISPRQKIWP
ncbi:MAG: hypothetical protein R2861_14985 [Desulfobacterales bacterium]